MKRWSVRARPVSRGARRQAILAFYFWILLRWSAKVAPIIRKSHRLLNSTNKLYDRGSENEIYISADSVTLGLNGAVHDYSYCNASIAKIDLRYDFEEYLAVLSYVSMKFLARNSSFTTPCLHGHLLHEFSWRILSLLPPTHSYLNGKDSPIPIMDSVHSNPSSIPPRFKGSNPYGRITFNSKQYHRKDDNFFFKNVIRNTNYSTRGLQSQTDTKSTLLPCYFRLELGLSSHTET